MYLCNRENVNHRKKKKPFTVRTLVGRYRKKGEQQYFRPGGKILQEISQHFCLMAKFCVTNDTNYWVDMPRHFGSLYIYSTQNSLHKAHFTRTSALELTSGIYCTGAHNLLDT